MSEDEKTLEGKTVDHLILLVGGNPLPNAVAGRLLVKGWRTGYAVAHSGHKKHCRSVENLVHPARNGRKQN